MHHLCCLCFLSYLMKSSSHHPHHQRWREREKKKLLCFVVWYYYNVCCLWWRYLGFSSHSTYKQVWRVGERERAVYDYLKSTLHSTCINMKAARLLAHELKKQVFFFLFEEQKSSLIWYLRKTTLKTLYFFSFHFFSLSFCKLHWVILWCQHIIWHKGL